MKYWKFEFVVENLGRIECVTQNENELLEIKNLFEFIVKIQNN